MADCLLGSLVLIPTFECKFVVIDVCYHVKVFVTSWSLVQRSPTNCGASLCVS